MRTHGNHDPHRAVPRGPTYRPQDAIAQGIDATSIDGCLVCCLRRVREVWVTTDDFIVDHDARTVTCPAGHSVGFTAAKRTAKFGKMCTGCPLVALCTNVSEWSHRQTRNPRLVAWARSDDPPPRPGTQNQPRLGCRIWTALRDAERPRVAAAWMNGANPRLGEDTPLIAIREMRPVDVVGAAEACIGGTYAA